MNARANHRFASRVLVVGSCNADLVLRLPSLPLPGQTVRTSKFAMMCGGKGANQAVAAARAGARTELVSRIGRDPFGATALRALRRERVGISDVCKDPTAPTGLAFICVDARGENLIAVASGANDLLSERELRAVQQKIEEADIVVAQLEIPVATVACLAKMAREAGRIFILNPAPAYILPRRILRWISVLTPNEGEACFLTGINPGDDNAAAKAAARLLAMGVGTVVVTRGARGALLATSGGQQAIAAHPVKAVDTTGAGDAFTGALAAALAEGQSMAAAVRFANIAAALSTQELGAQTSPRRGEVDRLLSFPRHRC